MSPRAIALWFTCAFLIATPTLAATDYFLELDGIPGESTDARYPRMIRLNSFSLGVQSVAVGKPVFSDVSFSKQLDKSSPLLYLNSASGKHLKQAILHLVARSGTGQFEFYTVKLTDVVITSVSTSGSALSDTLPLESFSLNFTKIEFTYTPQKPDGTADVAVKSGWDLINNVPIP